MQVHLSEDQEIRDLQLKVLSLGKDAAEVSEGEDETFTTAQTVFSGAMESRG